MRSKVLSGLRWSAGTKLLSQMITWVVTIVVMRLLSPTDYGLLAIAMVFVNFLALMAEMGLGSAIVQFAEIDEARMRQVFGLVLILNTVLCLLLILGSGPIASFYDEPRLVPVICVLALQFLIMALTVVPEALLQRRLDYKRRSLVDLAGSLVGSAVMLGLALAGVGVWALVIGSLAVTVARCIGMNAVSRFARWPSFSLRGSQSLLKFGGSVTATRIMWFLYGQADTFIGGKLLTREALGFYSVSMELAALPVQRLSAIINQVAFPAYAKIQNEPERIASYTLKAFRLLSFAGFPVLWGISSIAPELVAVLLGPKWLQATLPLQVLALSMPLRMLSNSLGPVLLGIGRPDVILRNVLPALLIMPPAFIIGCEWGPSGLAVAWASAFPLVFLSNMVRALPATGLDFGDLFRAIGPPAVCAGVMYGAVVFARSLLAGSVDAALLMVILCAVGAATYTVTSLAINRHGFIELLDLVRR